jgi:hypothetical protein
MPGFQKIFSARFATRFLLMRILCILLCIFAYEDAWAQAPGAQAPGAQTPGAQAPGTQSGPSLFRSPPIVGGTGGLAFPEQNDKFRYGLGQPQQHKTVTGQPCVTVNGLIKAQIVNPNVSEHVLLIANSCSYPIKLTACYYQSTTCMRTTIAAYGRRQQTLGFASEKDFRFSYTEEFN